MPWATSPTTVATGILRPLTHGVPPSCSGLAVMRSNIILVAYEIQRSCYGGSRPSHRTTPSAWIRRAGVLRRSAVHSCALLGIESNGSPDNTLISIRLPFPARTHNPTVPGSSPGRPTINSLYPFAAGQYNRLRRRSFAGDAVVFTPQDVFPNTRRRIDVWALPKLLMRHVFLNAEKNRDSVRTAFGVDPAITTVLPVPDHLAFIQPDVVPEPPPVGSVPPRVRGNGLHVGGVVRGRLALDHRRSQDARRCSESVSTDSRQDLEYGRRAPAGGQDRRCEYRGHRYYVTRLPPHARVEPADQGSRP